MASPPNSLCSASFYFAAQKVRALPTFIFFKGGERITEMTGAKTSSLRKMIDAHK